MKRPQSYENHVKIVAGYHRWTTAFLVAPTLWFAWVAVSDFSVASLMMLVFAVGVLLAALHARLFPLGVQDRVIRLEERLRMERLFPDDLRREIESITTPQLIALRFAPDDELEDLVRRVIAGELTEPTAIKVAVKSWRADHQRI